MLKKKIEFSLFRGKDIDRAIKELKEYKKDLLRKTALLRERIAETIKNYADLDFSVAIVDDIISGTGSAKFANVNVKIETNGNITVIIADGKDAVWVEFGAGVYHNGSVGSSPNPLGENLGFRIGEYGLGYGKYETWYFKDRETGEKKVTRGTPASMPMYKALESVINNFQGIVGEVFK